MREGSARGLVGPLATRRVMLTGEGDEAGATRFGVRDAQQRQERSPVGT